MPIVSLSPLSTVTHENAELALDSALDVVARYHAPGAISNQVPLGLSSTLFSYEALDSPTDARSSEVLQIRTGETAPRSRDAPADVVFEAVRGLLEERDAGGNVWRVTAFEPGPWFADLSGLVERLRRIPSGVWWRRRP